MERTTKGKNIVMSGMIDLLRKPCGAVPIRTGCDIPAGSSVFTETFRKQTGCCRSGTDQCNNLRLERRQPRQCSTSRTVPCIIPHGSGKHNAFVVFSRFFQNQRRAQKSTRGVSPACGRFLICLLRFSFYQKVYADSEDCRVINRSVFRDILPPIDC